MQSCAVPEVALGSLAESGLSRPSPTVNERGPGPVEQACFAAMAQSPATAKYMQVDDGQ